MNRTVAPKFAQAQDLNIISPERIVLHNGAVLFWLKDVKDDSVKLDIEWDAGTKYQDKRLTSTFTNKLLLAGNNDLTAKQIAEEIDFYGGFTQLEIDKDHAGIVLYGLRENMASIFDVFKRAFEKVSFPESEFKKEIDIAVNKFKVESQKVKTICRRTFTKNLFGESSGYGQVAKETDFKAIDTSDLKAFFEDKYQNAPVIFLTGNVDQTFIDTIKTWTEQFETYQFHPKKHVFNQTKGPVHIEKADAIQSAIRVGRLMYKKDHPDYFNFQLLNTILGGYFGSRLMANIREDKGFTYGIGSGMAVLQDQGYFFIATEVGKDVKEKALQEIYFELDQLKENLIPEEELTKVKNFMLGEFLRQADGPIAMMEIFKNIYFNKLSKSYYSDFIKAIHAATPEDLQILAKKYLVKEEMLEVVAG